MPKIQVPFTNEAVEFKDWPSLKPNTPLGSLPVLDVDGKFKIAQSNAILRYFGKLGGLYPDDHLLAVQVDSMLDTAAESTLPIEMSVQGAIAKLVSDTDWTKDEVLEIRGRIAKNKKSGLPRYLSYFEAALQKTGSGWLVGASVTIADLGLHRLTGWIKAGILDGIPAVLLDDYPLVSAHHDAVESIPEVVAWRTKYPTPYKSFEFTGSST